MHHTSDIHRIPVLCISVMPDCRTKQNLFTACWTHACNGACITQSGQRSKNEHCIPQWQRGGGYPLSINTARHSSSRPSPLPIHCNWKKYGCHGDAAVSGQPAFTSCCYCGFTSSLGSEGRGKNSSLIRKQDVITPFPLFLLLTITIPAVYS